MSTRTAVSGYIQTFIWPIIVVAIACKTTRQLSLNILMLMLWLFQTTCQSTFKPFNCSRP
jgi:hypothetical protein